MNIKNIIIAGLISLAGVSSYVYSEELQYCPPLTFPSWLNDSPDREVLKKVWDDMEVNFCDYSWDCLLAKRGNDPQDYRKGPNCIDSSKKLKEKTQSIISSASGWRVARIGVIDKMNSGTCHSAVVVSSGNNHYLFDPYLNYFDIIKMKKEGEIYRIDDPQKEEYEKKLTQIKYPTLGETMCSDGIGDYWIVWDQDNNPQAPMPSGANNPVNAIAQPDSESCPLPNQQSMPEKPIQPIGSFDPNDKVGARGHEGGQFVREVEALRYSISFENLDTATASAQEIVITDDLTPNINLINLSTLSLGSISFGNKVITPPSGQTEFATDVDLRPDKNLLVRINAKFDTDTNMLSWHFSSIDPATGELTTDPLAGFLPPNTNADAPKGSGSVLFTVMPKQGLPTGTEIRNYAKIVFDTNQPINTPEWWNTIDNTKPESQVLALPATQTATTFPVSWSGSDVGAGVKDYSIFVSDNTGTFTPWLTDTSDTQAMFTGQVDHHYGFYSVARDWVGNAEAATATPDTSTTITPVVINVPPVANAGVDITAKIGQLVTLQGTATDPDNAPAPLTYVWTQTGGANVTLSGANTLTPSFTPTVSGDYVFSLVASDGKDSSVADTVTVNVAVAELSIRVIQPNGGESWKVDSQQTIMWSVSPESVLSKTPVSIFLSEDAGNHWLPIGIDFRHSGSYTWRPDHQFVTSQALIKVCLLDHPHHHQKLQKPVCDVSDATFTIMQNKHKPRHKDREDDRHNHHHH